MLLADANAQLDYVGAGYAKARGGSSGLAASPIRSPLRRAQLAVDPTSPHSLSGVNGSWAQDALDLEEQMDATKARLRALLSQRPL